MSLLRALTTRPSKPPVPYSGRRGGAAFGDVAGSGDPIAQMGNIGTLFSIVNRLSTATAEIEWDLFHKPADDKVEQDEERESAGKHAALDLWRSPNRFMTRYTLVEACQQHLDLVGETFLVVVKVGSIPIELWPVRPDRMTPVPDANKFLAGYVYKTPDGEKIPLGVDEVIHVKMPNPIDPFRGLGPVQSIMTELDSVKYSAEWNRNFFLNSAEPGGVIELPVNLSDAQWGEFVERWRSQHQGVKNAHRVAVIEHAGKYVARGYSQRDMEFTALRTASRDTIMEAFGVSKPMLGITDDVNRANAEASIFMFSRFQLRPRLRRWSEALNSQLLPLFGAPGERFEFDFDDPVEENSESAALDRTSRVAAVTAYMALPGVKFDVDELLEAFDLPVVSWEEAAMPLPGQMFGPDGEVLPPPPPVEPGGKPGEGKGQGDEKRKPSPAKAIANAPAAPEWDPSEHDAAWQLALERLLEQWQDISAAQRGELADQIADAIDDEDLAKLADLTVSSENASERLHEALLALHAQAAAQAVDEGAVQGVALVAAAAAAASLAGVAAATAGMLAAGLAVAAGREALRRVDWSKTGREVAAEVTTYLREQSDRPVRDALGGALTGTMNRARVETFTTGPVGALYADEQLDGNTCGPCRAINGRFIATTDDLTAVDRLYTAMGGYVDCLGGARCRGSVTGVWRPATTGGES